MGLRSHDIVGVQPLIEANALGKLINAAIRRLGKNS